MAKLLNYRVLSFPAKYGKPYDTNWLILAMLAAYWRTAFYAEVRIVHTPTGKHVIVT